MTLDLLKTEVIQNIKVLEILNSTDNIKCQKLSIYKEILIDIDRIQKKEFMDKIKTFSCIIF